MRGDSSESDLAYFTGLVRVELVTFHLFSVSCAILGRQNLLSALFTLMVVDIKHRLSFLHRVCLLKTHTGLFGKASFL